ncbi:MAG: mycothiol synthase [Acidimicrobiia bacterium]
MIDVSVRRPVAPADAAIVQRLADAAAGAAGHPVVGDSVRRDLAAPTPGSAVVVAAIDGDAVGALHVAPPENDDDDPIAMAVAVDPGHLDEGIERALVDAALHDPALRGRSLLLWVFGADSSTDRFAAAAGFTLDRELHQMRVPLPLPAAVDAAWPAGVEVRPFRPGIDEAAWLTVNNRSFVDDPDQRGWTLETLRRREAEPWFDPAGFLLAWLGDALTGFCWTKVHPPAPPREPEALGEIYVIGVDPDHKRLGLGRALVVDGLASLHEHGATCGMLFVDAANAKAVTLYDELGFTISRTDRAYARDVP